VCVCVCCRSLVLKSDDKLILCEWKRMVHWA